MVFFYPETGLRLEFQEFLRRVAEQYASGLEHVVIPVYKRLSADLLTPVSAYLILRKESRYSFLLESVEGGEKLARYSFLGKNPYRIVRAFGKEVMVEHLADHLPSDDCSFDTTGNIFTVLQQMLDRYTEVKIPGLPRFASGAVGYLGYDAVRLLEHLPSEQPDDLALPDAIWCFYDTFAAFDHVKHQLVLISSAFIHPDVDPEQAYNLAWGRLIQLETEIRDTPFPRPEPVHLIGDDMVSNVKKNEFEQAVEKAKNYIFEGDIFQVVLSQRFSMPFSGDRINLYRALRQVNPSPYLVYLDFDSFALIGSSPEVLVRVENGRAEVLPIAGTRPRGRTEAEDQTLEKELLADPKERAEHLMLVDLGRNDLGRVCAYDSVNVDRYAYIERYSHVMHIVSSVSGSLDQQRGAMEVLGACFPAGTVSGAPKVRAMEIIDELEPSKRGIYAGAIGYVDYSGNLDSCIAIRTMIVRGNTIYIQAGAGVVADSNPSNEFEETINKARALKQAILLAAEGLL